MSKEPCFHCGLDCPSSPIALDQHLFCCNGCKVVYQLLESHGMMAYYQMEDRKPVTPKHREHYEFLNHPEIISQLLDFDQEHHQIVRFKIPDIHCSSCIYVLEQLEKFDSGIHSSVVNFVRKEVRINFSKEQISLKSVAELLDSLGYPPLIQLDQQNLSATKPSSSMLYKIGYAGFAFGNIMFLSFPEYFDIDEFWLDQFKYLFRYLMLMLSLPVVFYAARDYFMSAIKGIKTKQLNIDVPIALGVLVLFVRSLIEIVTDTGSGYLDSLSGLVFFLLLGKYFQNKTYEFLSFERDYRSYLPIGVTRLNDQLEELSIPTEQIVVGYRLLIRHQEIVPVDGFLVSDNAQIDYSFVTGESHVIPIEMGQSIFAGGKQMGSSIVIESLSSVQQSKLIQLWNNTVFRKNGKKEIVAFVDRVARSFTIIILVIALVTGLYWSFVNPTMIWNTVTAVLIIACPCALALSGPFAFGNLSRILAKKGCYAKNTNALERLCKINAVVFDKTGTLTTNITAEVRFVGTPLDQKEIQSIRSLVGQSNHPLSRLIYNHLQPLPKVELEEFKSVLGQGLEAKIEGSVFRVGSAHDTVIIMMLFGLGTVPVMSIAVFWRYLLPINFRNKWQKAVPIFLSVLAILLILRGLRLNIPMISPSSTTTEGLISSESPYIPYQQ